MSYGKNNITMIGESPVMQRIFNLIYTVGRSDANTLIIGETGTGKELVARAINAESSRAEKPYINVNCADYTTDGSLENLLFGHEKGAYTSADASKLGLLKELNDGTLVLDEITALNDATQKKLLRALQEEGDYMPIGSNKVKPVTTRFIGITQDTLKLKDDIRYRFPFSINLPPLRERKEDIPLLVAYFLERYNKKYDKSLKLSDVEIALLQYPTSKWEGNVRQLENVIHNYIVTGKLNLDMVGNGHQQPQHDSTQFRAVRNSNVNLDLPPNLAEIKENAEIYINEIVDRMVRSIKTGEEVVTHYELKRLESIYEASVLALSGDNKELASQKLGISKGALYAALRRKDFLKTKEKAEINQQD